MSDHISCTKPQVQYTRRRTMHFPVFLLASCFFIYCKSALSLQPNRIFIPKPATVSLAVPRSALFSSATSSPMGGSNESGSKKQDTTPWTQPRLHNTAAFRSLAILGAIAAAGLASPTQAVVSAQARAVLHLFSFSTWFGTMVYTTFVLGITMFKNLPRQTFGKLQAKLFPKYFMLSSIMIVVQLITVKGLGSTTVTADKSTVALLIALVMTLLNQLVLEPIATKNMMRRYELDDVPGGQETEEYKTLKASFGKFHGISSLTNLIALCAAVAHGFFLSGALVK